MRRLRMNRNEEQWKECDKWRAEKANERQRERAKRMEEQIKESIGMGGRDRQNEIKEKEKQNIFNKKNEMDWAFSKNKQKQNVKREERRQIKIEKQNQIEWENKRKKGRKIIHDKASTKIE